MKRKKNEGYRWQALQRATRFKPISEALIAETIKRYGGTKEDAVAKLEAYHKTCEVYRNDLYQVEVRRFDDGTNLVHINIRRVDGAAIIRDWRHFQQIKNELLGKDCEAIELYPAEDRKVDASNKYHLWGFADPKFRFPVGFEEHDVSYESIDGTPGLRQRPQSMRIEEEVRT